MSLASTFALAFLSFFAFAFSSSAALYGRNFAALRSMAALTNGFSTCANSGQLTSRLFPRFTAGASSLTVT